MLELLELESVIVEELLVPVTPLEKRSGNSVELVSVFFGSGQFTTAKVIKRAMRCVGV